MSIAGQVDPFLLMRAGLIGAGKARGSATFCIVALQQQQQKPVLLAGSCIFLAVIFGPFNVERSRRRRRRQPTSEIRAFSSCVTVASSIGARSNNTGPLPLFQVLLCSHHFPRSFNHPFQLGTVDEGDDVENAERLRVDVNVGDIVVVGILLLLLFCVLYLSFFKNKYLL